jgi:CDP-glycerol glycerophosphotransferase
MLLFTYDLDHYRDRLRGLYLDLKADAPGPLLTTTAEVIAAVRDIDDVEGSYQQARSAFAARFCPLDDGHAAARAVDRLLREQQSGQ